MPPFDYDLGDAGKLVSDGWMFWSSYNTERATGKLEVTASQRDRDYIAAVNWREVEKAAAAGQGDLIGGVRVIDPKKVPGLVYLMPCGKSPHGVDVSPDGKYIIGSGKLAGITTAFNFEKIQTAIRNKDFTGEEDGIPVLKYEDIKDAEVPVGLGPLHTQFGPNGMAYTSLFVDSAIASWKLGEWKVIDKVPVSYCDRPSRGGRGRHGAARTASISCRSNKLSHGRHLNVGPSQPESSQLIDISEEKMKLLYDAFTEPGAALRPDRQGRQAASDRGLPEGREQEPAGRLGRQPGRRHATGQQGHREDGRRALDVHADVVRSERRRRRHRGHHEHRADDRRAARLRACSTTTSTWSSTRARRRS